MTDNRCGPALVCIALFALFLALYVGSYLALGPIDYRCNNYILRKFEIQQLDRAFMPLAHVEAQFTGNVVHLCERNEHGHLELGTRARCWWAPDPCDVAN